MREVRIENGEVVLLKTEVTDILFEVWSEGNRFEIRLPDPSMNFDDISLSRAEIKTQMLSGRRFIASAGVVSIGKDLKRYGSSE